ncbi:MAG TPA: hypothetical protein VK705_09970 [Ferruginibacter sp.]|jgi:uncharacterized low-complexity protein|nr:hypothetical protein [Ferruginibacter sp.]
MSNKNLFKSSIIASAIVATAGFNANASTLFNYSNLGSGQTVRTSLLEKSTNNKTLELKCGIDSTKGKDAKCGTDSTKMKKKGKDGKCGEGKCGSSKKS